MPEELSRCTVVAMLVILFAQGCGDRRGDATKSGRTDNATSEHRSSSATSNTDEGEPLLLLAAASTRDAVEELAVVFKKKMGTRVRVSAGPSNTLAAQIASGAPADLFLSANENWAQYVAQQGMAEATTPLLTNHLALIVPRNNPADVRGPTDLARPRVKRVALAGENVPAGIYAEQALRALALYEPLVDANKIVRGQDVRITLSYVARGEAEAGIVYDTDARIEKNVMVIDRFDPKTYERIVYPLVLVKREPANPAAPRLYEFFRSAEASAIFEKFGFERLQSP